MQHPQVPLPHMHGAGPRRGDPPRGLRHARAADLRRLPRRGNAAGGRRRGRRAERPRQSGPPGQRPPVGAASLARPAMTPAAGKVAGMLGRAWGIARSLAMYHGIPGRHRRMSEFYRQFLGPGDLGFDIGAHVGSRVRAWRRLGARVIAVEPQPDCVRILRLFFGRDQGVTIVPEAIGAQAGRARLALSTATPTVSSMSPDWIESLAALGLVERLGAAAGGYRYNYAPIETMRLASDRWLDAADLVRLLERFRPLGRSGDIYARLA